MGAVYETSRRELEALQKEMVELERSHNTLQTLIDQLEMERDYVRMMTSQRYYEGHRNCAFKFRGRLG